MSAQIFEKQRTSKNLRSPVQLSTLEVSLKIFLLVAAYLSNG